MMDAYSNMAGMWIVGEDMLQATNRITLSDSGRDQWDLPVANVHFDDHPNDLAMRTYAYEKAEELYKAVCAVGTNRTPPYFSKQNLGICRMSANPEDGVVKNGVSLMTSRTCLSLTDR